MTRLAVFSAIIAAALGLLAGGLTGCEDVSGPEVVCIPPAENHRPRVVFKDAYAEGVVHGKNVVIHMTGHRDTVPMGAKVTFEWAGEDPDKCGRVVGYRFRITGDTDYTRVGRDVTSVTYTGLPAGVIMFRLAAIDDEGAITDPDSSRVFVSNFDPDTWYDTQFIERREVGGTTVEIVHQEDDTVAVGSQVVFLVHATDPDGDNEKLQYSRTMVTEKACGGGSVPAFSFFDTGDPGPSYTYAVQLSSDTKQTGFHRCWARTKDEHGRIDGTRAIFRFYSNLPPVFGQADVQVNGYPLDERDSFHSDGSMSVRVTSADDPDPGDGPPSLQTRCELRGLDVPYSAATGWEPLGEEMVLDGITQEGRYKLNVRVVDAGCRESMLDKEIVIIIGAPNLTCSK